jgi:hypothetical protein
MHKKAAFMRGGLFKAILFSVQAKKRPQTFCGLRPEYPTQIKAKSNAPPQTHLSRQ